MALIKAEEQTKALEEAKAKELKKKSKKVGAAQRHRSKKTKNKDSASPDKMDRSDLEAGKEDYLDPETKKKLAAE